MAPGPPDAASRGRLAARPLVPAAAAAPRARTAPPHAPRRPGRRAARGARTTAQRGLAVPAQAASGLKGTVAARTRHLPVAGRLGSGGAARPALSPRSPGRGELRDADNRGARADESSVRAQSPAGRKGPSAPAAPLTGWPRRLRPAPRTAARCSSAPSRRHRSPGEIWRVPPNSRERQEVSCRPIRRLVPPHPPSSNRRLRRRGGGSPGTPEGFAQAPRAPIAAGARGEAAR